MKYNLVVFSLSLIIFATLFSVNVHAAVDVSNIKISADGLLLDDGTVWKAPIDGNVRTFVTGPFKNLDTRLVWISADIRCSGEDEGKVPNIYIYEQNSLISQRLDPAMRFFEDSEQLGRFKGGRTIEVKFPWDGMTLRGGPALPGIYVVKFGCGDSFAFQRGHIDIKNNVYLASGKYSGDACSVKTRCEPEWLGCKEEHNNIYCKTGDICTEQHTGAGCSRGFLSSTCSVSDKARDFGICINMKKRADTTLPMIYNEKVNLNDKLVIPAGDNYIELADGIILSTSAGTATGGKETVTIKDKKGNSETRTLSAGETAEFKVGSESLRVMYEGTQARPQNAFDGTQNIMYNVFSFPGKDYYVAEITWKTNRDTTSRVNFVNRDGSVRYGYSPYLNPNRMIYQGSELPYYHFTRTHSVPLPLDKEGEEYEIEIVAIDKDGSMATKRISFVNADLKIKSFATMITKKSVKFDLDTSVATRAEVKIDGLSDSDNMFRTSHELSISGLNPDEWYFCELTITDAKGNSMNKECDFKTLSGATDNTPPAILGLGISATRDDITVSYGTDEESGTYVIMDRDNDKIQEITSTDNLISSYSEFKTVSFSQSRTHSATFSYPQTGATYYAKVIAKDGSGNEKVSNIISVNVPTEITKKLPNLLISDLEFSNPAPKPGDSVIATVTVENNGDKDAAIPAAGKFIMLKYGSSFIGTYSPPTPIKISRGSSRDFKLISLPITANYEVTRTVKATVNSDAKIGEQTRADNTYRKSLSFANEYFPDLVVDSDYVRPSENRPLVNEQINLRLRVMNRGNDNAVFRSNDRVLEVYEDGNLIRTYYGRDIPETDVFKNPTEGKMGIWTLIEFNLPYSSKTDKNAAIRLVADPGNVITEEDETNNEITKVIPIVSKEVRCGSSFQATLGQPKVKIEDLGVIIQLVSIDASNKIVLKMTKSMGTIYEKTDSSSMIVSQTTGFFGGDYKLRLERIAGNAITVKVVKCPSARAAAPSGGFRGDWEGLLGGMVFPFNVLTDMVFD